MAKAVADQNGVPVSKELVTFIGRALGKLEDKDVVEGFNLPVRVTEFEKLLGKTDGPKLELAKSHSEGSLKKSESRSELLGRGSVSAHDVEDLEDEMELIEAVVVGPSKEAFTDELDGITDKHEAIYEKLTPSLREAIYRAVPEDDGERTKLKDLLHFSGFKRGETTKESRLEVRSVLLVAVSQGFDEGQVKQLKEFLRSQPAERSKELLETITGGGIAKHAIAHALLEARLQQPLPEVDKTKLPQVVTAPKTVVQVSETTAQNLSVAHVINFTVKDLLDSGAPNQAPDVFRSHGRNYLLHNNTKLLDPLWQQPKMSTDFQRAFAVDTTRKGEAPKLPDGEDLGNLFVKSRGAVAKGTGKCAEHAATSFELLTDPQSLKKLGVEIPDGSQIILALGDRIDHNYVLIASPGSVHYDENRRLVVDDERGVVVVDPWMPIPVAHTLDRCNGEIQKDPQCKVVVEMRDGKPVVLDRGDKETEITPPTVPVIEQFQSIKKEFRPTLLSQAKSQGIISSNDDTSFAMMSGTYIYSLWNSPTKPVELYRDTWMSTATPDDDYQTKSGSLTLFVGNPKTLETTHGSIDKSVSTTVPQEALKRETRQRMQPALRDGVQRMWDEYQDKVNSGYKMVHVKDD